ncbi:hypothetical protein BDR03DRAFT_167549 [Suillus americanus]|nr:hypothetical protein BDR03DRAFT_167549 [Suillus americanus]
MMLGFVFLLSLFFSRCPIRSLARVRNGGCVPSINVNQCSRVASAMKTRTKRLVFQMLHLEVIISNKNRRETHVRTTRFVDVQATTILLEN